MPKTYAGFVPYVGSDRKSDVGRVPNFIKISEKLRPVSCTEEYRMDRQADIDSESGSKSIGKT